MKYGKELVYIICSVIVTVAILKGCEQKVEQTKPYIDVSDKLKTVTKHRDSLQLIADSLLVVSEQQTYLYLQIKNKDEAMEKKFYDLRKAHNETPPVKTNSNAMRDSVVRSLYPELFH